MRDVTPLGMNVEIKNRCVASPQTDIEQRSSDVWLGVV